MRLAGIKPGDIVAVGHSTPRPRSRLLAQRMYPFRPAPEPTGGAQLRKCLEISEAL
jgi:hypothetical protein